MILKTTISVEPNKFFVGIVFDEISIEKYMEIWGYYGSSNSRPFKDLLKVNPVLFGSSMWYLEEYEQVSSPYYLTLVNRHFDAKSTDRGLYVLNEQNYEFII